jgi:ppGpp synthetase/RelA/SpoT-type nucleotidyltranferase
MDLQAIYERRFQDVLTPCANALQEILAGQAGRLLHVDRVSVRPKAVKSFLKKAQKAKDQQPYYKDPLGQIQDQIGARIIVFYTSDIVPMTDQILHYHRHIEMAVKEPETEAEFGYFGKHFVLALPDDCVPTGISTEQAPRLFELQIRTLFQHAWSEAEHDLAYKPDSALTADQKRRFAFTAAQAWGADRVFDELRGELDVRSPLRR